MQYINCFMALNYGRLIWYGNDQLKYFACWIRSNPRWISLTSLDVVLWVFNMIVALCSAITSRSQQLFLWSHHIRTVGPFRFRLVQIGISCMYVFIYIYIYIYRLRICMHLGCWLFGSLVSFPFNLHSCEDLTESFTLRRYPLPHRSSKGKYIYRHDSDSLLSEQSKVGVWLDTCISWCFWLRIRERIPGWWRLGHRMPRVSFAIVSCVDLKKPWSNGTSRHSRQRTRDSAIH